MKRGEQEMSSIAKRSGGVRPLPGKAEGSAIASLLPPFRPPACGNNRPISTWQRAEMLIGCSSHLLRPAVCCEEGEPSGLSIGLAALFCACRAAIRASIAARTAAASASSTPSGACSTTLLGAAVLLLLLLLWRRRLRTYS